MTPRRSVVLLAVVLAGAMGIARGETPVNPLDDAREGEWVIQRTSSRWAEKETVSHTYLWVSRVRGRQRTVMMQVLREDLATGERAANAVAIDLDEKKAQDTSAVTEDVLEVKGRKLRCARAERTIDSPEGKLTTVTWTSNELPVFGEVRRVTRDASGKELVVVEAIDWGTSGGAEKPVG